MQYPRTLKLGDYHHVNGARVSTARRASRSDVLIIGSGIMGACVAQQIRASARSARIAMVDGGRRIGTIPGQHLHGSPDPQVGQQNNKHVSTADPPPVYMGAAVGTHIDGHQTDIAPGLYSLAAMGDDATAFPGCVLAWNVGGMGVHWTGATPWPWAQEEFPHGEPEQWANDRATAQRLLHVHPDPFGTNAAGLAVLAALDNEFGAECAPGRHPQPMPMAAQPAECEPMPRTGPNRVFPPIGSSGDPGFTLYPGTLAIALAHDGRRVRGARVRDLSTSEDWSIEAAVTIVCADTIRTPQLLFASDIRPTALGCYLNDHALLTGRALVDITRLHIDSAALPIPRDGEWATGMYWLPHSGSRQPFHGQIIGVVQTASTGEPVSYQVRLSWYVPTESQLENRLMFSETEIDAVGLPRVSAKFSYSRRDLELIEQARESQRRAGERLGLFDPTVDSTLLPPGSSLHYTGTVRMGQFDDGTSVCDPDGRVWGFDNLYVAGNGAIPTTLACNSTLTAAITAVRVARAVITQLLSRR